MVCRSSNGRQHGVHSPEVGCLTLTQPTGEWNPSICEGQATGRLGFNYRDGEKKES